ncbi:MAG TPA: hypothetical protein VLM40_10340, partial [Gemmata sp.]|nr:hypothetical protein [Gemmata sp.]
MVRFLSLIAFLIFVGCSRTTPPQPQIVEPPGPSIEPVSDEILPPPRVVGTNSPSLNPVTIGVAYLLNQQFPDGSWHSDVYAAFKDGTALTPLVLCALLDAADAGIDSPTNAQSRKKAVAWLAKFVKPDGSIDPGPDGFEYSIYNAALTLKALSHKENAEHSKTRDAWAKF